jgi:hypothetical protein
MPGTIPDCSQKKSPRGYFWEPSDAHGGLNFFDPSPLPVLKISFLIFYKKKEKNMYEKVFL